MNIIIILRCPLYISPSYLNTCESIINVIIVGRQALPIMASEEGPAQKMQRQVKDSATIGDIIDFNDMRMLESADKSQQYFDTQQSVSNCIVCIYYHICSYPSDKIFIKFGDIYENTVVNFTILGTSKSSLVKIKLSILLIREY